MKLSFQEFGPVVVFTMSGDFTVDDVPQFERTVEERIGEGAQHIMIDCEHLEFIDSAGLECWLDVQESAGRRGGQLRLINPDEGIATILRITRMDRSFESLSTLEAAVRSVR
jgi:anti-anti-sigma factor